MRYQFVDCRWDLADRRRGRDLYLEGHIPGASFLDVDEDLSAPPGVRGRHPLPEPEAFAAAAGGAGIGTGVFVVANGLMGGAERLWWLLRHFGHDDCAVIDLDAWTQDQPGGGAFNPDYRLEGRDFTEAGADAVARWLVPKVLEATGTEPPTSDSGGDATTSTTAG